MKHLPKKSFIVVAVVALLTIGVGRAFTVAQSTQNLSGLTRPLPIDSKEYLVQQGAETPAQLQQFRTVWAARHQRDVTNDLLPFINSSTPRIRLQTIEFLGRMESSEARAPIEAVINNPRLPDIHFQLALGRIKSRGLQGQAKVEAMMKEVGLTWNDTILLSQKVNGKQADRTLMQNSDAEEVMDELTDLLHVMAEQGQDVKPITKQLTLLAPQKAWIEAADSDDKKEARMALDFLMGLHVIRSEDYRLMDHLVEWNTAVADVSLEYLEEMKHNPKKYYGLEPDPAYPGGYLRYMGYSPLIRIAAQTGDKRMLPYFQYFQKTTAQKGRDEWVHREAEMAIQNFDLRAKGIL